MKSPRLLPASLARRRGFTIAELLVTMVITAVLGMALVRTMVSSNRYINRLENGREARGTARAAVNMAALELRMVSASTGVEAASATSLTLRVPFRLGLECSATVGASGVLVAAFLPADTSIASVSMGYNGFGYLQSTGAYAFVSSVAVPTIGAISACTGAPASMTLAPGSVVLTMIGAAIPVAIDPATPVVIWRRVRYEFAPSMLLPGRTALWRRQLDNAGTITSSEELAAPLLPTSRFGFFINNQRTSSDTVPTALANLRGIELRLVGESARTARGTTRAEQASLVSAIFFLNRPD